MTSPRSNFFSPLRIFQRGPPISVKKYLTEAEYQEQGKVETDKGLIELRVLVLTIVILQLNVITVGTEALIYFLVANSLYIS